eukprot:14189514-Alexandrium_andersonii.AAC.1
MDPCAPVQVGLSRMMHHHLRGQAHMPLAAVVRSLALGAVACVCVCVMAAPFRLGAMRACCLLPCALVAPFWPGALQLLQSITGACEASALGTTLTP